MAESAQDRSNLEKLDDLQAAHPFPYNLAVGAAVGAVGWVLGFHLVVVSLYALSYASLRWYLWGEGRVLHRQYVARAARWSERQAARRRRQ